MSLPGQNAALRLPLRMGRRANSTPPSQATRTRAGAAAGNCQGPASQQTTMQSNMSDSCLSMPRAPRHFFAGVLVSSSAELAAALHFFQLPSAPLQRPGPTKDRLLALRPKPQTPQSNARIFQPEPQQTRATVVWPRLEALELLGGLLKNGANNKKYRGLPQLRATPTCDEGSASVRPSVLQDPFSSPSDPSASFQPSRRHFLSHWTSFSQASGRLDLLAPTPTSPSKPSIRARGSACAAIRAFPRLKARSCLCACASGRPNSAISQVTGA